MVGRTDEPAGTACNYKCKGFGMKLKDNRRAYYHQYYITHRKQKAINDFRSRLKRRYGSIERYDEAMLKYDGECAFGCDMKAKVVHHLDGISSRTIHNTKVNNSLNNLLPLCNSCHTWLHRGKLAQRILRERGQRVN